MDPYRGSDLENRLSELEVKQYELRGKVSNLEAECAVLLSEERLIKSSHRALGVVLVAVVAGLFLAMIYVSETAQGNHERIERLEMRVKGLEKTEHIHKLVECGE